MVCRTAEGVVQRRGPACGHVTIGVTWLLGSRDSRDHVTHGITWRCSVLLRPRKTAPLRLLRPPNSLLRAGEACTE